MQLKLTLANHRMRLGVCGAALLVLVAGCSLRPGWHWEKPGADDAAYDSSDPLNIGVARPFAVVASGGKE